MPASTRSSSSRLVEREEAFALQRVERHVDAPQPGGDEIVREPRASFTPFVVIAMSTPSGASSCDQPGDVRPHERLAAGEADRLEPEALDADPGDPGDLLVGEQLVAGQPLHALFRHAVRAAEVAAVGDRDPQILDAARERIDQGNGDGGSPLQVRRRRTTVVRGSQGRVRSSSRRRSDQLQPQIVLPWGAASRQPRAVALPRSRGSLWLRAGAATNFSRRVHSLSGCRVRVQHHASLRTADARGRSPHESLRMRSARPAAVA